MPERSLPPSLERLFQQIFGRLDNVERRRFKLPDELAKQFATRSYSWQSAFSLSVGTGHKLHADRDGSIRYIRAERSAADGTTTASFDVRRNGVSIVPVAPTVDAGEAVGPDVPASPTGFKKGDSFEIEILATGGGTGPLRVTICYFETLV